MTVVVVIQARTGSSRLPGKVLLPCAGSTVLRRMIERVTAARTPDDVVVATTERGVDDAIADLASAAGVRCVRGSELDLLDRHLAAARETRADVVVKIPSDCPLIDPMVIDHVIGTFGALSKYTVIDYLSNLHPPSWPDGFDVEVMTRDALEIAGREATRAIDREHTTPYLWDNPERFRTRNVCWDAGDLSDRYRLTLDYPEDYQVIRGVFDQLWSPARCFDVADIVELLEERPALRELNRCHVGTGWTQRHRDELKTSPDGGLS